VSPERLHQAVQQAGPMVKEECGSTSTAEARSGGFLFLPLGRYVARVFTWRAPGFFAPPYQGGLSSRSQCRQNGLLEDLHGPGTAMFTFQVPQANHVGYAKCAIGGLHSSHVGGLSACSGSAKTSRTGRSLAGSSFTC
jgi:hypothetical protein